MVDFSDCKGKVVISSNINTNPSFNREREKKTANKMQLLCMKISQWNDFHSIYSEKLMLFACCSVKKISAPLSLFCWKWCTIKKGVPATYFAYFKLAFVHSFFFFFSLSLHSDRTHCFAFKVCISAKCTVIWTSIGISLWRASHAESKYDGKAYKFDERHLSIFFFSICKRSFVCWFIRFLYLNIQDGEKNEHTQSKRWPKTHENSMRLIVCTRPFSSHALSNASSLTHSSVVSWERRYIFDQIINEANL